MCVQGRGRGLGRVTGCLHDFVEKCSGFLIFLLTYLSLEYPWLLRGAWWPSGRVSDSGARGQGFDTYIRRVVSFSKVQVAYALAKTHLLPEKYWLYWWLCPDMTEKLLTGTLSINTNKSLYLYGMKGWGGRGNGQGH